MIWPTRSGRRDLADAIWPTRGDVCESLGRVATLDRSVLGPGRQIGDHDQMHHESNDPLRTDLTQAEQFADALRRVREGDDDAIGELWNGYFQRLVRLAAKRLPSNLKRAGDEEDIALSAFNSFIAGIRRDQFPDLSGPDNLWGLLITLTGRKVSAHLRFQTRQKRGGGVVRGESVFMDSDPSSRSAGIGGVSGLGQTPDLSVELEEACNALLDQLPDAQLRQIAVMRMDGFLVDEIADRLGLSKRGTERRLQLIRRTWSEAAHSDEDGVEDSVE